MQMDCVVTIIVILLTLLEQQKKGRILCGLEHFNFVQEHIIKRLVEHALQM
jgi:hypothetical protein